jgi:hypothetical protein
MRKSKKELREQQSAIWGKLHTEEVVFYDASTHPLGDSKLTINRPRVRWMGRWMPARDASDATRAESRAP